MPCWRRAAPPSAGSTGRSRPDRWKADEAACRAEATREVDRDSARDQGYGATARERREHPVRAQMATFEATKKMQALIERCMKANGYVDARE